MFNVRSVTLVLITLLAVSVASAMEIQNLGMDLAGLDVSYRISFPVHRGSSTFIGFSSDMNGVCRYLGFQRYADQSAVKSSTVTDTVHINTEALGDSAPVGNAIDHLVCLNRAAFANSQKSALITAPKHSDSGYDISFYSSGLGVCRYFRYTGFATGSIRKTSLFKPAVILDEAGNVSAAKVDLTLKSILCFYEN